MVNHELEDKKPLLSEFNLENFLKNLFEVDFDQEKCKAKLEEFDKIGGISGILKSLQTNQNLGLDINNREDLYWRKEKFGTNKKNEFTENSYFSHLCEALGDEILIILLIAALISLTIGILNEGIKTGWIEGFSIILAVFIIINITAYTNLKEEREFNKLNTINRKKTVQVLRNGKSYSIDTEDLFVGDIILYKSGDLTDVDAIALEINSLEVDESAITGESKEVKKFLKFNLLNITNGPLIYSGCAIKNGMCKAVVANVGENTVMRQNEKDLDTSKLTPLQEKLDDLKDHICRWGYIFAIIIGMILLWKEIIVRIINDQNFWKSGFIRSAVQAITSAILVLVIALPEGLPMAVTLSLVHSTQKMKNEKNLVKYIKSCETMGNVNELCSDKTGTLTTGEMTLSRIFIFGNEYIVEDNEITIANGLNTIQTTSINIDKMALDFFHLNLANNISKYEKNEDGKLCIYGSMTDQGYINFVNRTQCNLSQFEMINSETKEDLIKMDFNSNEKFMASTVYLENRKCYRILVKGAYDFFKQQNRFSHLVSNYTYIKNNQNNINYMSIDNLISNNEIISFDQINLKKENLFENYNLQLISFEKNNITSFDEYLEFASENCLRTIFFGFKDIPKDIYLETSKRYKDMPIIAFKKFLENDVILTGLCSFYDPPRNNISEAIQKCKSANVNLRMITGDDLKTAISIANKLNIINEEQCNLFFEQQKQKPKWPERATDEEVKKYKKNLSDYHNYLINMAYEGKLHCLEGATLNIITGGFSKNENYDRNEEISINNLPYLLNDEYSFSIIVKNLRVIGRCSNENKLLMVIGLKQLNNIVAVIGDGTNDAVSLKNSDVGFAMGIRGTEVAKCAADIILMDDSFNSIITAIKYGRNIFDSIKKFLQFQLTINIVAVSIILIGGIALKDSPFNSVQMLWVNLVQDTFAALALATEPPSEILLTRKPVERTAKIVTKMMLINIFSQSLFQIFILVFIIFKGDAIFNVPSDRKLDHFTWNQNVGYHFTILFNIFVFMQIFNSISSRKLLKTEWNIFKGIFNNPLYLGIQAFTIITQIFMVQFGGRALRTHPLSLSQHLGCILIASSSMLITFIVKVLPFNLQEEMDEYMMIEKKN